MICVQGVLYKETFVLNISEANERNITEWKHEYTFTVSDELTIIVLILLMKQNVSRIIIC